MPESKPMPQSPRRAQIFCEFVRSGTGKIQQRLALVAAVVKEAFDRGTVRTGYIRGAVGKYDASVGIIRIGSKQGRQHAVFVHDVKVV